MVEKIKTHVDRLLLILIMKRKFPIYFFKIELFLFSKLKVVYLRLFLSSLLFPKFKKQNFMYFGHKHVET